MTGHKMTGDERYQGTKLPGQNYRGQNNRGRNDRERNERTLSVMTPFTFGLRDLFLVAFDFPFNCAYFGVRKTYLSSPLLSFI
jgi:hypothetical protein